MPPKLRSAAATFALALLPAGFLALMVAAPLYSLLSYQEGVPLWREVAGDAYYRRRLLWTLLQAAATVPLTMIIGIPAAWVLARLKFRGRALVLRLLMLPFVTPTLVAGMGVLTLFGSHGALWPGWEDTPWLLLYGNVFFNLPVMVRAAYQGLLQVPANRLYAAQTLGAGAWRQFWLIERPVLLPWLAGGVCMVFLYCFSGFGLALLLGGQDYATIEVEIYQLIAYQLDMEHAAVLVWPVLAISALAGGGYALASRCSSENRVRPWQPESARGIGQHLLQWASLLLLALCCALPLAAVAFQAALAGADGWRVLLEKETLAATANTLRFTAAAVALSAVLGVAHAALARRLAWVRALTFLPFMVSPVCLSFGVLLLYNDWAAELPMLIALYALLAYPFVTKDVLAAWDALPQAYTAAARVYGATPFQAASRVTLPLLLPALRRGLTLAAATGIGEFAATLFLSRPEWTTLTTLIYQYLSRPGAENRARALVLTLVLMLLAAAVFLLLDAAERRRRRA